MQAAIVHAEFEAIHPFLDGNGRLGRMCIPLFLYKVELIQSPMFYISAFFELNRDEYFHRLYKISKSNDWTSWCKFFLTAVRVQAEENQKKASEILKLYEKKKEQIVNLTHSQYSIHAIDFIFENPIFKSSDFTYIKKIPSPTAKRILTLLRDNEIIRILREARGRRSAFYVFPELLNIAEGRQVF